MLGNLFIAGNLDLMRPFDKKFTAEHLKKVGEAFKGDVAITLRFVLQYTIWEFMEDFGEELNVLQVYYDEVCKKDMHSLSLFLATENDAGEREETLFLIVEIETTWEKGKRRGEVIVEAEVKAKGSEEITPYFKKYYKKLFGREPKIISEEDFLKQLGNDERH